MIVKLKKKEINDFSVLLMHEVCRSNTTKQWFEVEKKPEIVQLIEIRKRHFKSIIELNVTLNCL